MAIRGVDVSSFQGEIDWNQVKDSGIGFAMVRAGYGWENILEQTDEYFYANMKGTREAGIPAGCYLYSYATNIFEARQEADFLLNIIKGYQMEYPVAYDIEDSVQRNLSRSTLTDIALAFLERIEEAGYYPALYANLDWVKNRFEMNRLKDYTLWLAQYYNEITYDGEVGIWQYTNSGLIKGINGRVDLDWSYVDFSEENQNSNSNNGNSDSEELTYTVLPGDTMWGIAQKYNIPLERLVAANPQIEDPSLIYPGQEIIIPGGESVPEPSEEYIYTVRPGDTMWGIAQKYNISLERLFAANPQIEDPSLIYPGQEIIIPGGESVPEPSEEYIYTVRLGDTMWGIAQKYNISLERLFAANPQIEDPSLIYPGQEVIIP